MKLATIGNCQSGIIALILGKLINDCEISNFNIMDLVKNKNGFNAHDFDFVFLMNANAPKYAKLVSELETLVNVFKFPNIIFSGFHPDYIYIENTVSRKQLGNHSNIIFNSYLAGLEKVEVKMLFTERFYELLGYKKNYFVAKNWLIKCIDACEMDGSYLFDKWSSDGVFMYTMNHPKLRVLEDIAHALCVRAKIPIFYPGSMENIVNDPLKEYCIFPATSFSSDIVKESYGKYIYKLGKLLFSLEQFIDHNYHIYNSCISELKVDKSKFTIFSEALEGYKLEKNAEAYSINPYKSVSKDNMWRHAVSSVSPSKLVPLIDRNPIIDANTRVATAGSCFAQHISRTLAKNNLDYYVAENKPEGMSEEVGNKRGYGLFSARYGNVYTARQLLQLFKRAYGKFEPEDQFWLSKSAKYIDPFRPNIGEEFETITALVAQREVHLAAVREMFEHLDVFVFTLGLTESWLNTHDGAVYPVAPGVITQHNNYAHYAFKNFTHAEIREDMIEFFDLLRSVNRSGRILLTVSPVPLIATYEVEHVLSANTYSKSVLRAVAGELTKAFSFVSYFPSYEIITGNFNKSAYYEPDLRLVKPEGVSHVMRIFMDYMVGDEKLLGQQIDKEEVLPDSELLIEIEKNADILCDEELIES